MFLSSKNCAFYPPPKSLYRKREAFVIGGRLVNEQSQVRLASVVGQELDQRVNKDLYTIVYYTLIFSFSRAFILVYLIGFVLESLAPFTMSLIQAFGFETEPIAGACAIYYIFPLVTDSIWKRIMNYVHCRMEYNADAYSKKLGVDLTVAEALI